MATETQTFKRPGLEAGGDLSKRVKLERADEKEDIGEEYWLGRLVTSSEQTLRALFHWTIHTDNDSHTFTGSGYLLPENDHSAARSVSVSGFVSEAKYRFRCCYDDHADSPSGELFDLGLDTGTLTGAVARFQSALPPVEFLLETPDLVSACAGLASEFAVAELLLTTNEQREEMHDELQELEVWPDDSQAADAEDEAQGATETEQAAVEPVKASEHEQISEEQVPISDGGVVESVVDEEPAGGQPTLADEAIDVGLNAAEVGAELANNEVPAVEDDGLPEVLPEDNAEPVEEDIAQAVEQEVDGGDLGDQMVEEEVAVPEVEQPFAEVEAEAQLADAADDGLVEDQLEDREGHEVAQLDMAGEEPREEFAEEVEQEDDEVAQADMAGEYEEAGDEAAEEVEQEDEPAQADMAGVYEEPKEEVAEEPEPNDVDLGEDAQIEADARQEIEEEVVESDPVDVGHDEYPGEEAQPLGEDHATELPEDPQLEGKEPDVEHESAAADQDAKAAPEPVDPALKTEPDQAGEALEPEDPVVVAAQANSE